MVIYDKNATRETQYPENANNRFEKRHQIHNILQQNQQSTLS